VDLTYFRQVTDYQCSLTGIGIEWAPAEVGGREASSCQLSGPTGSSVSVFAPVGDFIFNLTQRSAGELDWDSAARTLIGLAERVSSDWEATDCTGGLGEYLLGTWQAVSTSHAGDSSAGFSDKWTFYPDGVVYIESFSSFSGEDVSWSDEEATQLEYWVLGGQIFLFGTDGYGAVPFQLGQDYLQVGDLLLTRGG